MKKIILFIIVAKIIYENFGMVGLLAVLIAGAMLIYFLMQYSKQDTSTKQEVPGENIPHEEQEEYREDTHSFPFPIPDIKGAPKKDDGIYREESMQEELPPVTARRHTKKKEETLEEKGLYEKGAIPKVESRGRDLPILNVQTMQNAVIMAEVLAKPLAFRKRFGFRKS